MTATAESPGEARVSGELPFAYTPAKLLVPAQRPGSISRVALVNRLRAAHGHSLVAVVAPAGAGKTTILAQWAARDDRRAAWVSIDDHDNDPLVFLRHVAAALDRVEPLDRSVLTSLRSRNGSLWTAAVPRLAAALSSRESPCIVVLDDAGRLVSDDSLALVSVLADHVPDRSTLVLAGRAPIGPIASIRARGLLLEVGPELIRLSNREAEDLLQATRIELDGRQVAELVDRSEGWPAFLYLSALAIRDGHQVDGRSLAGDDRYLADYFRAECLAALSSDQLDFLRWTSILETLSGAVCDAVLERRGSGRTLAEIGAANLFLEPVDASCRSYRCHGLFRDLLRSELEREEPERVAQLHRLAADWYEANGEPTAAIDHSTAAGDIDRLARLVTSPGTLTCDPGRAAAFESWLRPFGRTELERFPAVAMLGAWVHACLGRAPEAAQWLAIAETGQGNGPLLDGLTTLHPWQALVRAVLCEGGVERMLVDAEVAVSELPPTSPWRPVAQLLAGAALALLGDADRAEAMLADAADTAEALGATDTCVAALSERALVAADRGDNASAEHLSERARLVAAGADVDAPIAGALEAALFARTLLRRRTWNEARDQLASADRLPAGPSRAFPWLAVQAQLELAGAYLTLRDPGAAQAAVAAAREILDHMPWLGLLDEQAAALQQAIDDLRDSQQAEDFGLTPAELRLIPLLASHLSFPEIGARFFLSRNTIKTQAISIYRKLGASSRSEAVERARSVGLLDGALGATGEGDDHVQAQALAG